MSSRKFKNLSLTIFSLSFLGMFESLGKFFEDIVTLNPIILQLLILGLLIGGIYALAAMGLTMIFGVMDVINFAHGAFILLGMYTIWYFSHILGLNPFLIIPLAVIIPGLMGALSYFSVINPIVDAPQQNQLIVTLGLLLILRSCVEVIFTPDPRSIEVSLGELNFSGIFIPTDQLIGFIVALGGLVMMLFVLYRTDIGLAIRATANNRFGAKYCGIPVNKVNLIAFGLGTGLAGLSGSCIALFRPFDPFTGDVYLIYAFIIVILGGLGSFTGAFVGGLTIGLVEVFGSYYLPGTSYQTLVFVIFIAILLLKPEGLLGGGK